ncbi:hypothetical protein CRUP_020221 [Coryphaenoides rupestris]|nr:hypothetical protein CRUP_020221 [Coryphaenoides rupestris]
MEFTVHLLLAVNVTLFSVSLLTPPPTGGMGKSVPLSRGYRRPRTRFPLASTTVLLPITAKGMLSWWDEEGNGSWSCCLKSSSSSESQSGNW